MAASVVLLLAGAAVGLVLGEGLLRLTWKPGSDYRALRPGLSVVNETSHLVGVQGPSTFKTNSMGVRAREWSADRASEYRVLVLGASAMESIVVDQSRVWSTLLEAQLERMPDGRRPWVGNIGRAGLTSREHVLQMRHLPAVYDPDLVVLMVGINDLLHRLALGDAYDPRFAERPENLPWLMDRAFAVRPGALPQGRSTDSWLQRTYLWRLGRVLKYQLLALPEIQDSRGENHRRWKRMRAEGGRISVLPPLDEALAEYQRNLQEIVRLAAARKTPLLLVTQPALWRADLTVEEQGLLAMGGVGDYRRTPGALYYEASALAQGLDAYNAVLREVCRLNSLSCVDLARLMPKTTEYLYDDCHLTDRAQVLVASALAEALDKALLKGPTTGSPRPVRHS